MVAVQVKRMAGPGPRDEESHMVGGDRVAETEQRAQSAVPHPL